MKFTTPKIDKRKFKDFLEHSRSLAQSYTPDWVSGQQDEPGEALLKIYIHMQEQILNRLNRVPDKNFVAFLDMMGFKLLSAQSAKVAVTFTLATGTTEHVVVPNGTLVSGGDLIFQTQKDRLVTPAVLRGIFSYDVAEDIIYGHSPDEKGSLAPFTVFEGTNMQERSLYLGHANLLNQKKPAKIKVDFALAEPASVGSDLNVVWDYYDGERWAEIIRFDRDPENELNRNDTTALFTKSGAMILEKRRTGEIAETEVGGVKSRWIRCRLSKKLPGNISIRLPEINDVRISVEPSEPFAPDLAFNNDIPLNLEEIRVSMVAKDSSLRFSAQSPPVTNPKDPKRKEINVIDTARALVVGDFLKLEHIFDGMEIRQIEAIVDDEPIIPDGKIITLNEVLRFNYDKDGEPPSKVSLFTALRPADTSVKVNSIVGLEEEVSGDSKLTLFHQGQKENADLSADPVNDIFLLIRGPGSKPVYVAGDVIKITPKIKPFGELPQIFDTFYIASDEAFSKKRAKIILDIEAEWKPARSGSSPPDPNPILSWEYWNGKSWRAIRVSDTTKKFSVDGNVIFTCPDDIEKIEVNNEEKYWIRVRIIDSDFGKEIRIVPTTGTEVAIAPGNLHFPTISKLTITYENVNEKPEKCLTRNSLNLEDHTDDAIDENKTFAPFTIMPEQFSSLFLGFDKALRGGPLSILFDLKEQFLGQEERVKVLWFYWNGDAWTPLNLVDETENLTKIGALEFIVGNDFAGRQLFGQELFWLKGSIVEGEHPKPVEIKSLYPNTAYALQADVANNEIAGSSDGRANQEFTLQHPLVVSLQVLVREPILPPDEEQETIRKEEGRDAIKEKKNELGETLEILIKWHAVEDFDDSDSKSRHYTIDEHLGKIKFGDGKRGMVPPVGADNIIASYTFGGGKRGNVPVNFISGLKSAVPFVNKVANPLPADGGSETETLDSVLTRAPLMLKNRNRAVMPEDFEALAKIASRKVARAKCLPNADEDKNEAPGWVTVLIVPDSDEPKPLPSQMLIKIVEEELEKRCVNVVSSPAHISVTGPDYTEIIVEASVAPASLEKAAAVETGVREKLNRYIHPLTGGPYGTGWEFGEEICLSDIMSLIEGTEDVDHVEKLILRANGKVNKNNVPLDKYSLPVSGGHKISVSADGPERGADRCKSSETDCAVRQEYKLVECQEKES